MGVAVVNSEIDNQDKGSSSIAQGVGVNLVTNIISGGASKLAKGVENKVLNSVAKKNCWKSDTNRKTYFGKQ